MRFCSVRAAMLALILALASPAAAGAPTEALRAYLDRAFTLLGDRPTSGAPPALTRESALRALAHEAIDFGAAAEAALGGTWDARTPEERTHFVQIFTRLIDQSYL